MKTELRNLPMDSLARLIKEWNQKALEEWMNRYGHSFPVYAVIEGKEIKLEA